ncbi:zinc finger BED domain-containing protein RICESLEEPER 2, partial [Tanacetum coccineum]
EALESAQIDLDNSDLELGVEKNADKRAKRKTTGSKRKAPTKKKPKTEGQEQKSQWWKFFDTVYEEDEDGYQVRKGKCKFCVKLLATDSHTNGTSSLKKHIEISCKKHPDRLGNNQGKLQLKKDASGEGNSSSLAIWKHDNERIKKALIKLFAVGELPFAFVKNEAFVEYTESLNASFCHPATSCLGMY